MTIDILLKGLIILFIFLILYQFYLKYWNNSEGLETTSTSTSTYQPYDMNNPNNAMILAQQNAGNIQVLKQQLDSVLGLNTQLQDLSGNVAALSTQVSGLVNAQQQYASQNLPSSPPNITGTGAN
jgi:hypothetical protein